MKALDADEAIATLACHLPAGTTTVQVPDWRTRDVAEFQYQHLTAAGYVLVMTDELQARLNA